jgi:hypothetical protein
MEVKKNIFGIVLLCTFSQLDAGVDRWTEVRKKHSEQLYHVVTKPVVDVRSRPTMERHDRTNRHDLNQTTQLLFGERVVVHEHKGNWARITIPDQLVASGQNSSKLFPCPGWVEKSALIERETWTQPTGFVSTPWAPIFELNGGIQTPLMHLSLGTPLHGFQADENWWKVQTPDKKTAWIETRCVTKKMHSIPKNKKELRRELIKRATLSVGYPYVLGGRSMYNPRGGAQRTSVDCSSLIQLVYQTQGISVPRNAPAQYQEAQKISGEHCKPGDLIFLANQNDPERIFHVMLYVGNNHVLEASGDRMIVRIISCVQKFGSTIHTLKNGSKSGSYIIYFGKLL